MRRNYTQLTARKFRKFSQIRIIHEFDMQIDRGFINFGILTISLLNVKKPVEK